MTDDRRDDGPVGAGVVAPFPSLAGLTAADRRVLAAAMAFSAREAGQRGEAALVALASALRAALLAAPVPTSVALALADLDEGTLEHLVEALVGRLEPMVGPLAPGPRAFFDDLALALRIERERRGRVLSAIDAGMAWYEAHWPRG